MMTNKIKTFTELKTWQIAHEFILEIYKISKNFPKEERYSLVSQIRKSGISITSNIAEGFSRRSLKEKICFYRIALGSLTEIQNQFLIARDIHYLENDKHKKINQRIIRIQKLINGSIRYLKNKT